MKRSILLNLVAVLVTLCVAALPSASSEAGTPTQPAKGGYPIKGRTITMIVPSTAGGGTDVTARLVAPLMEKDLGTPIQIINKPGASFQVGTTEAAKAKPDGYTLVWTVMPTVASIWLDPERKAAFGRKDLQPIALVNESPFFVSVLASSRYKTLKDLVDAAKANPDKIKCGTGGYMATGHFASIEFARAAGLKLATVNFQGGAPQVTALLGGHIDVAFNTISEILPQSKNGDIRILGVLSKHESEFAPGVKTLEAQGYKVETTVTVGLASPAGLPKEVLDLLANSVRKVAGDEEFKRKMAERGEPIRYLPPQDYAAQWDSVEVQLKPLIEIAKKQGQ